MDLQNYTNVDIFRKVFEKRQMPEHTNMIVHPHDKIYSAPQAESASTVQRGFNPYTNNFGTTIGK